MNGEYGASLYNNGGLIFYCILQYQSLEFGVEGNLMSVADRLTGFISFRKYTFTGRANIL